MSKTGWTLLLGEGVVVAGGFYMEILTDSVRIAFATTLLVGCIIGLIIVHWPKRAKSIAGFSNFDFIEFLEGLPLPLRLIVMGAAFPFFVVFVTVTFFGPIFLMGWGITELGIWLEWWTRAQAYS